MIMLLISLGILCGCSKLTMENYSKIKMGIGYGEVVKILGKPDNCSEALFVRNCVWGNEQKNITVNFMGDKVILFTSKNIK
jgi:rRNA processing protein Krr1/Pno1